MSGSSRSVGIYFACHALLATATMLLVVESPLVGAALASDPRLATLPAALQQVTTLAATYPASQLMARVGRRSGFSIGAVLGVLGGVVTAIAVLRESLSLFCAGTALVGAYVAFAPFYRFAAAESAGPDRRERALSWILSAGVLAALLGPWLARRTVDLWTTPFVGSFALLSAMALMALLALQFLQPQPPVAEPERRRVPLRAIASRRSFRVPAGAMIVASAVMVFMMTATPLAMASCHHGFDHTARVIQWHVVAMYAPSLVTGRLVTRFGASQITLAGLSLCAVAALVNASGTSVPVFHVGLLLLGLGWNLAYIGGTTLVSRGAPEERATVQGLTDLLVISAVSFASLLAGLVQQTAGWLFVNVVALPPLVLIGLAIAAHLRAERSQSLTAPPSSAS